MRPKMKQTNQEKKRRRWTREETHGFLRCYLARKEEFQHRKKKRLAFTNVLEDMLSFGITDRERTPICLESKMRTLLQAYKAARDNNQSTRGSPCCAPFMEQMDEIFGGSPVITNNHTIHVSSRTKTTLLPMTVPPPTPSPLSPLPQLPLSPLRTSEKAVRKKRSARDIYYENKLELKKWQAQEKMRLKAESIQQFKDLLMAKFEKDAKMETEKLNLLEKLVNK